MGRAMFEVYRDAAGEWRWRLWSVANARVIADSARAYATAEAAERDARWVKEFVPMATVRRAPAAAGPSPATATA